MNALERRIRKIEEKMFPTQIVFAPLRSNPLAYPDEPPEPWTRNEENRPMSEAERWVAEHWTLPCP